MGASSGDGSAISSNGKLRIWVLIYVQAFSSFSQKKRKRPEDGLWLGIVPNADDTPLLPRFCPTCVAAGLTLRPTRKAYRRKSGSQWSARWWAVWGCQQLPLIQPVAADRMSRVVDRRKKESLFFGKKWRGSAGCGCGGSGARGKK